LTIKKDDKKIEAKTDNQQLYLNAIKKNDVILCQGPSGSGKTFCAIGYAIGQLLDKRISKIVIAKPLLEAEKAIGAMPGDLKNKTEYYYGSLISTVKEFIDHGRFERYLQDKNIEFLPISFWRGHTFTNSIVIVDESQNLLLSQFKLAVTRIGHNSKMIFCGDCKQSDLKYDKPIYGDCIERLQDIEGVAKITLFEEDIVRHDIISKILSKLP
jgi:phosphate starvation-inducible PhoH-like protein